MVEIEEIRGFGDAIKKNIQCPICLGILKCPTSGIGILPYFNSNGIINSQVIIFLWGAEGGSSLSKYLWSVSIEGDRQ